MKTPKEIKRQRRAAIRSCADTVFVYLAVVAGVFFTEIVLSIEDSGAIFVRGFSWIQIIAGASIAAFSMRYFEKTKDKSKRRSNWKRRASHGFAHGSALRGAIEILFFLFNILR